MADSAANGGAVPSGRAATGFYCSTSGTYFTDKESLSEHYKSDFHRYNLKRKVAGLPAVTKEWFDARKAQLSSVSTSTAASGQKVWLDPLTKKKFMSENTYQAHVRSKKYQDLVRASGAPALAPVVMVRPVSEPAAAAPAAPQAMQQPTAPPKSVQQQPGGFTVRPARRPTQPGAAAGELDAEDDDSGWETASDVSTTEALEAPAAGAGAAAARSSNEDDDAGEDDEEEWEEWDVRQSLFDGRMAPSFEDNLEYMYRTYGFYLPEASFLADPQGLVRYLGQKLRYGGIPLGVRGDDTASRRFRSLHAVQRHMVDTNQCKLAWEGNEDEYADYYDWGDEEEGADGEGAASSQALTLANADAAAPSTYVSGAYELVLGGADTAAAGAGAKVIGSREFARYYRQRPKPLPRADVEVNALVAKYRSLGIDTRPPGPGPEVGRAQKEARRGERHKLNMALASNKIRNLPNNVPY